MNRWDKYFYDVAETVSSQTRCLSRQVGAVLVRDGKFIVSTGYNGPPMGVPPCWDRDEIKEEIKRILGEDVFIETPVCPRRHMGFKSGQGIEWCAAAHAERNAIDIAARLGLATSGCTMYLNCHIPCLECAKTIVQAGIKEIVVEGDVVYENKGVTGKMILDYGGVKIRTYDFDKE